MNKREIVIETIQHKRSEVVPYNIDLTIAMREKLMQHFGLASHEDVGKHIGNFCAQLNIGSVTGVSDGIIPEIYLKQVEGETFVDDWGVIWTKKPGDDIGVVTTPVLREPSLEGWNPTVPASRGKWLAALCQENPDRFRLASFSSPIYQRCWMLRGVEEFLMDMACNGEFVHQLIDKIMDYTTALVTEALEYDIDGLFILEDYGQQEGLIMSPAMWREYFKPGLSKLFKMIKEKGKFVFFHSCGDIEELIPELIEMGVDVLNPFQPEVMDVYAIKEKFGDRLSFYGGVSTQELLPRGTVKEVEADVKDKIEKLGRNGGYIMAPAHAVQPDVPLDNLLALIRVAQEQ